MNRMERSLALKSFRKSGSIDLMNSMFMDGRSMRMRISKVLERPLEYAYALPEVDSSSDTVPITGSIYFSSPSGVNIDEIRSLTPYCTNMHRGHFWA